MKPDQATWYRACKTCNKKVTETVDTGYWCEGCQNKDEECCLRWDDTEIHKHFHSRTNIWILFALIVLLNDVIRYIIEVKVSDSTGEAWFSAFNVEAEKMIGCTNDELNMLKSEVRIVKSYTTTKNFLNPPGSWSNMCCYFWFSPGRWSEWVSDKTERSYVVVSSLPC